MLPIFTTAIGSLVESIITKFFPNTAESDKAKLQIELQALIAQSELAKAQVAVNTEEAKSDNLFVAGWRPACGWICCLALGYTYILSPFLLFLASVLGHPVVLPELAMADLLTILFGMLGLGGLRTWEKVQGNKK